VFHGLSAARTADVILILFFENMLIIVYICIDAQITRNAACGTREELNRGENGG
jgi:hypothetical protein